MSVELVVRAIDRSVLGKIEPDSCDWLHDLALASSLNAAWTVEPADLDRVVDLLDLADGWRVVDVYVRGEPAHSYVVDHVSIDNAEDGSLSWRLSASGVEQLLAGLPVLPEVKDELAGGPVDERIFGPGSYRRFDDVDNWADAQSITTLATACDSDVAYKCAGHGPYPRDGKWAVKEEDLLDDGVSEAEARDRDGEFPDLDAHWLAPPAMNLPDDRTVPPGSWWLRREFTLTEGLDFVVLATADEHFALYVDGVEMATTHGDVYQWQSWKAVEVGLPAGDHVIAARIDVVQRPCGDGWCDSSTAFLLAMWSVDTEEPPDRLDNVAPFLRTDTDVAWRCSDVGRDTGWTPGEVLIDLRDTAQAEAATDAVLPPPVRLTPMFDAAVDSTGQAWGVLVDFALNVTRSGGMEAVRKLIENNVDVGVDFPAGELNAWNERGVDRTVGSGQVELTAHRDVLTAGWELTAPSANSVKTRFRYGTLVVASQDDVDRFGRVWAPLSLGDALDERQAREIGERVLEDAAGAREIVPVGLADEGPGAQPLVDVRLGDRVWHDDRRRRRRMVRVQALTGRYQGERGVSWETEVIEPPPPATATITGTVTDSDTGSAIEGATVEAAQDGSVVGSTTTDANGDYTLADLETGTYDLTADATDYQAETRTIDLQGDRTEDFALAPASTYANEVLSDSPIAYWRLDDDSAPAVDETGNGHDADSVVGDPTFGAAGLINDGTAVDFDGSDGLYPPDDAAWDVADLTAEAWVKTSSTNTQQILCRDDNSSGDRAFQFRMVDGTLDMVVFVGGANTRVTSTTSISDGAAHHVVGTYDSGTGDILLYVDGSQVGSDTTGGGNLDSVAEPPTIGFREADNPTNQFLGVIDEAAYYGSVLSASRIQAHYDAAQ